MTANTAAPLSASRLNVRVDPAVKQQAEQIFEQIGLNLSDGINVFLRRVVADKGMPFSLTLARSQEIGEEAARMEADMAAAVKTEIMRRQMLGLPVARYDAETRRPYLEYSDGSKVYDIKS